MNRKQLTDFLSTMELVQNISEPRTIKISGTDIKVCSVKDGEEFFRYLISEIPNMYKFLKMVSKAAPDDLDHLAGDIKAYVEHREAVLESLAGQYKELEDYNGAELRG